MRHLFKNDILRLSKDIKDIKMWSVYFLINNNEIVYVGFSETPFSRLNQHLPKIEVDRYHIVYFSTMEEALKMEKHYIKAFKPFNNVVHNDECNKEEVKLKRLQNKSNYNERQKIKKQELQNKRDAALRDYSVKERELIYIKNKEKEDIEIENKLKDIRDMWSERDKNNQKKIAKEIESKELSVNSKNINIPNNTYVKKGDVFYLKIENNVVSSQMNDGFIIYERKRYNKPSKVFGSIKELI